MNSVFALQSCHNIHIFCFFIFLSWIWFTESMKVIKILGMVNCRADFLHHPKVTPPSLPSEKIPVHFLSPWRSRWSMDAQIYSVKFGAKSTESVHEVLWEWEVCLIIFQLRLNVFSSWMGVRSKHLCKDITLSEKKAWSHKLSCECYTLFHTLDCNYISLGQIKTVAVSYSYSTYITCF
jgi:hypothetical protein